MYHIVLGHNILSDEEIILVGLGELIEVEPMVEPLVAGPLNDVEDLLPGSYRINNSFVDLDSFLDPDLYQRHVLNLVSDPDPTTLTKV